MRNKCIIYLIILLPIFGFEKGNENRLTIQKCRVSKHGEYFNREPIVMGTLYKDPVFYVKSYKFDYKKIEANFILTDTKIETEEKKSVYSVFLVKKKKRGTKFKLIKILVDQLSTDESCQILLDKSERIIIIEIGENDGFCYNLVKSPK